MDTFDSHTFKDEWLLRSLLTLPGVSGELVQQYRDRKIHSLVEALTHDQHLTVDQLHSLLRSVYKIEPMNPQVEVDKMALALLPESVCKRLTLFPFQVSEGQLDVAMTNPMDLQAIDDVQTISGRKVVPYYCLPDQLESLLAEHYSSDGLVYDLVEKLDVESDFEFLGAEGLTETQVTNVEVKAPVVKLVNSLITKAILLRASDVHIEQSERRTDVRYRIDGNLRHIMTVPKHVGGGPLVACIKIMANLDIADHMKPQDGRARIRVSRRDIGLRVSTLPTRDGEKVVIRLLDPKSTEQTLQSMGFGSNTVARLETAIKMAQGVILVTGPTGSGKTTTLYALLRKLASPDLNITTVEDPVEYKLEGINQVQVNDKQGLGFSTVLRSVLRQDPDVILVGEMRDAETASTAFQAALTGHLVLSTLHTNDALSSITRLVDMGVERFKIAPGLLVITAQRLVRRLCPTCRVMTTDLEGLERAVEHMKRFGLAPAFYQPVGCDACAYSGYIGRMAVMEFLHVGRELRDKIAGGAKEAFLRETALIRGDLKTFLEDSLWHVSRGDTTLEEILPHINLEDAPIPAPVSRPLQEPSGKKNILIVDDDPVTRTVLRAVISGAGYAVEECKDGQEALIKISRTPPDLLLLDLNMPQVDGYGVIKGLRNVLGLTHLPIIVLTAVPEEKSKAAALELGATDYLVKPVKPPVVVERLKAVFRRLES